MDPSQAVSWFLNVIPEQDHMLCYFANCARNGVHLPLLTHLATALAIVDIACPGYASDMLGRMAAVRGLGEDQYETILEILSEIYVARGATEAADSDGNGRPQIAHESGASGAKNPECEVLIGGSWCALEVKTPRLIAHARMRAANSLQATARTPFRAPHNAPTTKPRDNPVKDFLISADAKFAAYESYRPNALRILV